MNNKKCTVKKLLQTALMPVGSVMYIYGGGWNKEDTGAGREAVSLGLSPVWKDFCKKQDSSYNYKNYDYRQDRSVIHLGLDCSGYVGWTLYNTFFDKDMTEKLSDDYKVFAEKGNTKGSIILSAENVCNNKAVENIHGDCLNKGFVYSSKTVAKKLADRGWGYVAPMGGFSDYRAGDILSAACDDCAHVWICVGQCADGSVVLLHSSPPGVMLSGTVDRMGNNNSMAVMLAHKYMSKYFLNWYSRFSNISRDGKYLSHYERFRWYNGVKIWDADGLFNMDARAVLNVIFEET